MKTCETTLCSLCGKGQITDKTKLASMFTPYICMRNLKKLEAQPEILCDNCHLKIPKSCFNGGHRRQCSPTIFKCDGLCGKTYRKTRPNFPTAQGRIQL